MEVSLEEGFDASWFAVEGTSLACDCGRLSAPDTTEDMENFCASGALGTRLRAQAEYNGRLVLWRTIFT